VQRALFVVVLALAATAAAPAHAERIASLKATAAVFRAASLHATTEGILSARTPISNQRTAVPVLAQRRGWLRVLLPGRPNGHTGWIRAREASLSSTPWRVVIRTDSKRLFVLRWGRIVRSFPVVVGSSSTPTPRGHFFVEEALLLPSRSLGAPVAYALSARSRVYQQFDGGPGQIAIHGIYGIGGTPGHAESHGCIRMTTASLDWMIHRLGTGTPVDIR
jgi:lipoprotein-anchoring transpeptidase ErfK/SrfK